MIELAKIRTDGGTQARAEIQEDTVADYAEAMADENTVFPPVIVYYDGKEYWLADGFHRVAAWGRIGRVEVPAEVRQGDRRRAILHSVAANAAHGLRRSNADKRRAVMTLLEDEEWSQWSNREIARRCGVSDPFVSKLREPVTANVSSEDSSRTYTTRHGTEAQMDTSKIGKPRLVSASPTGEPSQAAAQHAGEFGGKSGEVEDKAAPIVTESDPPAVRGDAKPIPDPYGYSRLTEEALLDTANGLRADLDEEREKRKKAEAEKDDLQGMLNQLGQDEDGWRTASHLKRQLSSEKQRKGDELAKNARLQRQVNAQKNEIEQLRKSLESQEITL